MLAKFLVGDQMTIADFVVSALFFNIIKNENGPFTQVLSQIIPEYPFLIAYEQRIREENATYLNSRQAMPF